MLPYQINGEHANAKIGNWPGSKHRVPGKILDMLAEIKIEGLYTNRRNPVCTGCYVRKANNGSCNC